MNNLLSTIRLCTQQNVKVLVMTFPQHPGYAKTEAYGTLGPTHATAREMISEIDSIARQDKNLVFFDAHAFGNHDFSEYDFFDCMHLCTTGARALSEKVDSIFNEMLSE